MRTFGPPSEKQATSRRVSVRVAAACGFLLGTIALGTLVKNLKLDVDPQLLTAAAGGRPLAHTWRLYRDHHWQIVSDPIETREQTDAAENNKGVCGVGMVQVKGNMKLDPNPNPYHKDSIEELQKTTCTKWINREFPERCAKFDRDAWLAISKDMKTKSMNFCMDRFEYPNQKGIYPIIMVNWDESQALCEEQGKRLCNETEWTFACEGEEATPYPYGYERDSSVCISDQKWRPYNGAAFSPREDEPARNEMDRLWQGKASGTQPRCKSPFGIYDMTGNVDEWTRATRPSEHHTILKGGYWGPVRTRCRPSTRNHDETHTFYQQGFRCCSDVPSGTRRVDAEDPSIAPLPQQLK